MAHCNRKCRKFEKETWAAFKQTNGTMPCQGPKQDSVSTPETEGQREAKESGTQSGSCMERTAWQECSTW